MKLSTAQARGLKQIRDGKGVDGLSRAVISKLYELELINWEGRITDKGREALIRTLGAPPV